MKNISKFSVIIILACLPLLMFTRCDGFMDVVPFQEYTEDDVFAEPRLVEALVIQLYNNIRHGALEHTLDGLTDDAYFTHNYGQRPTNEAVITAAAPEWFDNGNNPFRWQDRYTGIRNANFVLSRIDEVEATPNYSRASLNQMKGEAHYLRAHMYHELLRGYGGVPIVDEIHGLLDIDKMRAPRDNVDDVLAYILKDLTAAEELLPATRPVAVLGRATQYVATGLKARIQLHIASELYADRTVNTLRVNQYHGDRAALYAQAKANAIKVIDDGPYALIDCSAGNVYERSELFKAIITDQTNSEQMFVRNFGLDAGDRNRMGLWHGPNGYFNWSGTTPTHDLVMAFEFEDGSLAINDPDDPDNLFNAGDFRIGNPYNGREPRFYATVATDVNEWGRPRNSAGRVWDPSPMGRLQAGAYELTRPTAATPDNISFAVQTPQFSLDNPTAPAGLIDIDFFGVWGVDTRQGPIEDWNGSWTGYYERKLIDCAVDAQYNPQAVPWTFMRLAEMYTIAAEASVELAALGVDAAKNLEDAAKYIDILRGRVGNVPSKDALVARGLSFDVVGMRSIIRHERRVEFAYESTRYFDVRRWMIAPQTNSKPLTGIRVFARLKPGQTAERPYVHNEEVWEYHYYVNLLGNERRRWDNKLYFAPIHRTDMLANPTLVQNPGSY